MVFTNLVGVSCYYESRFLAFKFVSYKCLQFFTYKLKTLVVIVTFSSKLFFCIISESILGSQCTFCYYSAINNSFELSPLKIFLCISIILIKTQFLQLNYQCRYVTMFHQNVKNILNKLT